MAIILCQDCKSQISGKAKVCPQCGCPVIRENKLASYIRDTTRRAIHEAEEKEKSSIQKFFESSFVILFLLFGFSSCVYWIGYPYTCEQAKQKLEDAESEFDKRFNEARIVSDLVDMKNSTEVFNKIDAERKVNEKCD